VAHKYLIVRYAQLPVRIRWYAACPLSYRHIEEIMDERGVSVDHSTIKRWAIRFLPLLEKWSGKYNRKVGVSWRMDHRAIKRVTRPMLDFNRSGLLAVCSPASSSCI
jgi:transposase-like protein